MLPHFSRCVLLVLTCALLASPALGEDKPKPKPADPPAFANGKITKVSAKSVTIREHKQFEDVLTTLNFDDATKVLLPAPPGSTGPANQPHDGKVTDLKAGDIVSASYKKDGMLALKITVAALPVPKKK